MLLLHRRKTSLTHTPPKKMAQVNDAEFIDLVQNCVDRTSESLGAEHVVLRLSDKDLTDIKAASNLSDFGHFELFLGVSDVPQQTVIIAAIHKTTGLVMRDEGDELIAFQKHPSVIRVTPIDDTIASLKGVDNVKNFLKNVYNVEVK